MVSMLYLRGNSSLDSQVTIENTSSAAGQTGGVELRHGSDNWADIFYTEFGLNDLDISTGTSVGSPGGNIIIDPRSGTAIFRVTSLAGTGTACVQVDASGNTSRVSCGTAGALTALTHDVTASGPGSVPAEVTGITDGTSIDHQVGAAAWINGQGLVLDGAGHIVTAPFQTPLVACTDYVSVSCQSGATDIGGTNGTVTVIAVEDGAKARGYVDFVQRATPSNPPSGTNRVYESPSVGANLVSLDSSGVSRYMVPDTTCGSNTWVNQTSKGAPTCTQPAFSSLSGSASCSQLPALTGDATSSAGSCATQVVGIESGASVKGSLVVTEVTSPGAPGTGQLNCWAGSVADNATCINHSSIQTYMAQANNCPAHQWFDAMANTGGFSCAQPTTADVLGPTGGGTQCLQVSNTGVISGTGTACGSGGGGGTVTSVTGTAPITCTPSSPNPVCSLAYDNTTVTLNGSNQIQRAALTHDLSCSAGSNSCDVDAVENAAILRGYVTAEEVTTPATPASGGLAIWGDLTDLTLKTKDEFATITHTTQDYTCAANKFATHEGPDGSTTCTQAAFSGLSGSASCSQLPALTGDVTSTAGSCATTVSGLYKVKADSGDVVPDYLSSKVTSTSGTVHHTVTSGGGGSDLLNLNVIPSELFSIQLGYSVRACNLSNGGELIQGGINPNPEGAIGVTQVEYTPGVAAGTATLTCYLRANNITSGTYTYKISKNGADTAVALSFTSGSSTGVTSSSATISSPSTSDRWGLDATSVGTANCCNVSTGVCADLTCTVLLQP